ncbi:MAG TPA: choice-of-anchor tandem repeat GloVer-containing protein [Streptosporangiaceae bacterium]|nr:choice-of-anchor tandem repeat GloVer-containing protein [Streptosporangiaceae bacterium]
MGRVRYLRPGKLTIMGLAVALAVPFAQPASAAPSAAATVPGFTLSVVHQFPVALQQSPKFLARSRNGDLYGATSAVGSSNGTVFRVSGGSAYKTIAILNYGQDGGPSSAPFIGTDGSLYGLTLDGGSTGIGSIYKITPGGTFSTLLAFTGVNGMYPTALVQAPDGTFYGTTYYGGSHGYGNAYQLTQGGTFTNIVSCTQATCLYPIGLVTGADGNVYGISEGDTAGSNNSGRLFVITPKFRTEVNFNKTAVNTPVDLEPGHGRSLYGLTQDLYTYRQQFFRFTPGAGLKFLGSYHFPGGGAFGPQVLARNGDVYGALLGDVDHPGWIYQLTPAGAFRIVATFDGKDGFGPDELTLGANGDLYGTTESGGAGGGVIFRLTVPR